MKRMQGEREKEKEKGASKVRNQAETRETEAKSNPRCRRCKIRNHERHTHQGSKILICHVIY